VYTTYFYYFELARVRKSWKILIFSQKYREK
jgi:hypothetical protein